MKLQKHSVNIKVTHTSSADITTNCMTESARSDRHLWTLVMTRLPQLMKVTVSPSLKVSASAPSTSTLGPYHTGFTPTSAFCEETGHTRQPS